MSNPSYDITFAFIHAYAHPTGIFAGVLDATDIEAVAAVADGFGGGMTDPVLLADWSHIRDSSQEALVRMVAVIELRLAWHRVAPDYVAVAAAARAVREARV